METDPASALPAEFVAWIQTIAGEQGMAWLHSLPALLADCAARWDITLQQPLAELSYNYVAPAVLADGAPAIIKAGFEPEAIALEAAALRLGGGVGMVHLLEADETRGALLLERALPGAPLSRMEDDDQATAIAADLMRAIWRPLPEPSPFPTVAGELTEFAKLRARFGGTSGPLPESALARAEALARDLLASAPAQPMLLHGDLHHENIISAQRAPWLAIDPKGVTGDPCYEVGALLNNPYRRIMSWERREWPARMARRVDILAERLGFSRERIIAWGVTQATLSTAWGFAAGLDDVRWPDRIARADALASLL